MKKIGIITFHASHNCGSMLQAYALQETIRTLSECEVEIIHFSNVVQKEWYAIFSKPKNIKKIVKNALFGIFYKLIKGQYDDYETFLHEQLRLTSKEYNYDEELRAEKFDYDAIVAGSDQCWNIMCPDGDDAYFIDFVDSKEIRKVAYAPSLGSTNIKKYAKDVDKYRRLLQQFHTLSVRERNAKLWLEDLTERNVELLVDPTLLFDRNKWLTQFEVGEKKDDGYIFYYAFKYDKEVNKVVKKIARRYNKSVYVIDAKAWVRNALWKDGFKITQKGGPVEFLRLMRDADMILTTSFHGTVFSAVFHKKFWFLNSSMHSEDDDRATSLLAQIGLEERFIDISKVDDMNLLEEINYSKVDANIEKEKKKSLQYLYNAIFE